MLQISLLIYSFKLFIICNCERRFKAPSKKSTINMYQSPLENCGNDDKKARRMCCQILQKEKKEFMQQLQDSRTKRSTLETIAAIIIQTIYRGFIVRQTAERIREGCRRRRAVHERLVSFLSRNELPAMTTRGEHRRAHVIRRNHAATVIQCSFRCFLSKNFIHRHRYEYEMNRMMQNANKIQNTVRFKIARDVVARKRERFTFQSRSVGALKIQSQVRMLISRRKVAIRRFKLHWLAARMIQGCFRGRTTRKCMQVYLAAQEKVKFFRGARGVQRIIRGRIGRSRANRIKLRYLYLKIFRAATRIQTVVRRRLAVSRVAAEREERTLRDQLRAMAILAEEKLKDVSQAEELGNSMDIFLQTRKGDASAVDALYHSDLDGGMSPEDMASVTNTMGDTILSQATRSNRLDIIRKCIKWGYDVNHKNAVGDNVITLAATEGHMSVVTYLLSDSHRNASEILAARPKKEKIEEKKEEVKGTGEVEESERGDETFMTGQYERDTAVEEDEQEKEGKRGTNTEEEEPVVSTRVLNLSSEDMGTILAAAAKHPDLTYLKMIVENKFVNNIDEPQPLTDLTALHIACEEGHVDHVDFLLKNGASVDAVDDNGQLPLHKTAKSSLELLKRLLSLSAQEEDNGSSEGAEADESGEENPPTADIREDVNDTVKKSPQTQLLLKDTDGKDCFLIASLHGLTDVVDFIQQSVDMSSRVISEEIGWSVNDILNTAALAEKGNLVCLQNVILEGFDSSWCPEDTGTTIAMIACRSGRTDVIDYLLTDVGADFSACDNSGRNSLHYAAEVTRKDVIPLLLSAGDRAKESCSLSKSLLTVQDERGRTPVHCIAQHGSSLSFELLAQEALTAALSLTDEGGCTPLLVSCEHKQSNKIVELLKLGADATAVDNRGNCSLWHYFICTSTEPSYSITVNPSVELEVVQQLLKRGCPLFNALTSSLDRDMGRILSEYVFLFGADGREKPSSRDKKKDEESFGYLVSHIQPTDLAAVGNNLSFFNMLPPLLGPADCWGAVLSAIFFHPEVTLTTTGGYGKGHSKCLASLFDGNAVPVLLQLTNSDTNSDDMAKLESTLCNEVSILGWAISSKNEAALSFLLRKGMSPNAIVDSKGNNCLHYAVLCGTSAIVSALLDTTDAVSSEVILLEGLNKEGFTATMLGARVGSVDNTRAVLQCGASARQALGGKYWAWLLAVAMQAEKREINSQTGVYGDDDELYFPLHPSHNLMYAD